MTNDRAAQQPPVSSTMHGKAMAEKLINNTVQAVIMLSLLLHYREMIRHAAINEP